MLSTKLETSSLKLAIAGSLALRSYHHSDDLNAAARTAVIAKLDDSHDATIQVATLQIKY
jgi:hypothetical protein